MYGVGVGVSRGNPRVNLGICCSQKSVVRRQKSMPNERDREREEDKDEEDQAEEEE